MSREGDRLNQPVTVELSAGTPWLNPTFRSWVRNFPSCPCHPSRWCFSTPTPTAYRTDSVVDQFFDKYNEMDADGTGTMRVSVAWVDSDRGF